MTSKSSNGNDGGSEPIPIPTKAELLDMAANLHPFDLETRSILVVNAMIGAIDSIRKVPNVLAYLSPPYHQETPVGMLAGEYFDGLTMARFISGSRLGFRTEGIMRQSIYETLIDGFCNSAGGAFVDRDVSQEIEVAGHKHLLPSLLTLHRLLPDNSRPLSLMRKSLQAFYDIALRGQMQDGRPYIYYPVAEVEPGSGGWSFVLYNPTKGWQNRTREPIDTGSAGFEGAITLPFAQYYELTRDPFAAEFLEQFIRFLLERATDYNPDGSFTKTDIANGQVWSRMMTMEGILIYGLAFGNNDLVKWAQKAFSKALELHGTRFGWLPENLNFNHGQGCETDTMTAQIEIAFLLARRVDDAYWDVAERIALNQLMAQQLRRVDFLSGTLRLLGGFHSFCSPNDWYNPEGLYITQSSHGSGMRALYNVWYHAAWWEQGEEAGEAGRTLRVNLHWSKNLPDAQIISHLPSSTTLEIDLQRPCHLIVRKPDWAKVDQIRAKIQPSGDGPASSISITLRGRWIHLGHFKKDSHVVLSFPDEAVTYQDVINNRAGEGKVTYTYTTRWRGNAVLSIEPNGVKSPNYAGREQHGLKPYIPRHTAMYALDPIAMTPLEHTGNLRIEQIIQKEIQ